MALTPQQREEFEQLIFALRDQSLDRDAMARLERFVLEHADARELFVNWMDLQAGLHWRYAQRPAAPIAGEGAAVAPRRRTPRARATLGTRIAARHWIAMAAAVLLLLGLAAWFGAKQSGQEDRLVAQLVKASEVEWRGEAVKEGAELVAGHRLEIAGGVVELAFASGAKVILAGPSVCELVSPTRARLDSGSATAKSPPQLKGFTVETPSLTVVDLGTEFGVRADAQGRTEVHVFDGTVEAAATKNKQRKVLLGQHQAIQCDTRSGSLDDVVFDDEHFVREVTRQPKARPVSQGSNESFDSLDPLKLQPGYKVASSKFTVSADHHEGTGAVEVDWQAAKDSYGVIYLTKKIAPIDITGCAFQMWVKPLTGHSGYWGIELFDDQGGLVEQQRVFELKVDTWNRIEFQQGKKRSSGYLHVGPGNRRRVSKIVFRAQTRQNGQAARDLWDGFKVVPPQ